jgi:prevent-host-death family protein
MSSIHHPNVVGAYDAKTRFSELLQKVESGEEITITRHGTPIARMVPVKKKHSAEERREAIKRIQEMQKGLSLGNMKIRDLINEGRP